MSQTRAITLNALSLYAVALVLAAAYAAQFILHELPCPLCLLQRILFAALAVGPILNIRFGPRPSHYAMSLLAAVAGALASTRQVLLHIMPGDAGYGSALLGYHYYSGRCSASSQPSSCWRRSCCSTASSKRTRPSCRPPAAPSRKPRCGS
jgi:disulfide bond formation protein DsbB